jgi:hypothetical protein
MNFIGFALPIVFETILAVCAIFSFFWPRKALRVFYRSRKSSNNPFRVRIFQMFAGLVAIGMLWCVFSDFL